MANDLRGDKIIDSRAVIERIEELAGEREALQDDVDEAEENVKRHHNGEVDEDADYPEHIELKECRARLEEWDASDDAEELAALQALQEEAEGYATDWRHGATLIREDYFPEYAEELVKDIGDLPHDTPGYLVIDWEATAENLKMDYTEVDFDGTTYYVR